MTSTQLPLLPGTAPQPHPGDAPSWLERARYEAACYANAHDRAITTEELRKIVPAPAHQNAWGTVLCPPYFMRSSEVPSQHTAAHRRRVFRWLLSPRGRRELLGL